MRKSDLIELSDDWYEEYEIPEYIRRSYNFDGDRWTVRFMSPDYKVYEYGKNEFRIVETKGHYAQASNKSLEIAKLAAWTRYEEQDSKFRY